MLQGCGFYVYPGWTRMGECWRREKDASSNAFVGKVTNLLWFSSEKNGKAESGSREEARKARKEKKQGEGWHANGSVKNKSKALLFFYFYIFPISISVSITVLGICSNLKEWSGFSVSCGVFDKVHEIDGWRHESFLGGGLGASSLSKKYMWNVWAPKCYFMHCFQCVKFLLKWMLWICLAIEYQCLCQPTIPFLYRVPNY